MSEQVRIEDVAGKVVREVLVRDLVGQDAYKDWHYFTEYHLMFADGTFAITGLSDGELYGEPREYASVTEWGDPVFADEEGDE